jgi:N-methylhydantoinase A
MAPIAEQLGFEPDDVARGILTIATANMANAIREITVEQGVDPRRCTIAPFGGAGPLFGTLLARELDIRQIVVPPYAGNFSAWGLLGADLAQTASRTRLMRLDDEAVTEIDTLSAGLFGQLEERTPRAGLQRDVHLDVRYVGQEHTLTISAPSADGRIAVDAAALAAIFERDYARTFGATMDEQKEIVTVRAIVRLPRELRHAPRGGDARPARSATVEAWSFAQDGLAQFALVDRDALRAGDTLSGPAILTEHTATTYLDAGFVAEVHPSGALVARRQRP